VLTVYCLGALVPPGLGAVLYCLGALVPPGLGAVLYCLGALVPPGLGGLDRQQVQAERAGKEEEEATAGRGET
jgi:hypothetical protein